MTHFSKLWRIVPVVPIVNSIAAACTGLAIICPLFWSLVFVAPTFFLATLLSRDLTPTRYSAAFNGFIFGTVFNIVLSASAWSVYPLSWIGIASPVLSIAIIGIISLLSSIFMSIAGMLFATCAFEVRSRAGIFVTLVSIPLMWIVYEWAQALLSSIFMLGPTSTINVFFTLPSLGYALGHADELWIALARWGGISLLSFSIIACSSVLAFAMLAFPDYEIMLRRLRGAVLMFAIFLSLSYAAGMDAEAARGTTWNGTVTLAAAHTDFPAQLTTSTYLQTQKNEVPFTIARDLAARGITPDVVVFPETIGTTVDANEYAEISKLLPEGVLLVHSKYFDRAGNPDVVQVRSHVIGGNTAVTDKQFIMPYGEYLPYHFLYPLRYINDTLYALVRLHREYAGGTETHLGAANSVLIGVRACSEIFAPQLIRSLTRKGAGILVHTSSVAMFEGSEMLTDAMRAAARIRAVENGLPIVQSINGAEGAAFDCRGTKLSPIYSGNAYDVYRISPDAVCRRDI